MLIKAYAKLNLVLGVGELCGGFHAVDSVVCSVNLYDEITLNAADSLTVEVEGMDIPLRENNAYKAAVAFMREFKTGGAEILIKKGIPLGAGLGGSSADAAGVLSGMASLYGVNDYKRLKEVADGLGSDTGYMLTGGFARLSGRGEKVKKLTCPEKLYFLITVPDGGVSTAECYRLSDEIKRDEFDADGAEKALLNGDIPRLSKKLSNSLYPAALRLNGGIGRAVEELKELSPLAVNMTGSGSGVYALFQTKEDRDKALENYRGKMKFYAIESV